MDAEKNILILINDPKTLRKGFDLLVKTYSKQLYYQIKSIVKNHDDANDVLQNAFIKIWKNLASFKSKSKLSTWLFVIAKNETYTFLKKKNKIKNTSDKNVEIVFNSLKAEVEINAESINEKLNAAIELLPKKQKEVFLLRYFEEMKYAKMAEKLELSESALKSSYHFAVKKIEAFLKDNV